MLTQKAPDTPRDRLLVVDARTIRRAPTGIGNATFRQLRGIDRVIANGEVAGWRVAAIRLASELEDPAFAELWKDFKKVELIDVAADPAKHPAGDYWQQVTFPALLKSMNADVVYSPAYAGPLRTDRTRRMVMLHDDLVWTQPSSYPLSFRYYIRTMARLSARGAHRVIFPSEDARERCTALLGLPRERTAAVHHGIDLDLFQPAPVQGREKMIVCIASAERRKNHEVLLRALPMISPDVRMVFVGFSSAAKDRLQELRAINNSNRWEIVSGDEKSVSSYLRRAAIFALPSLGEGFGFPVIEAMASGTPCILSDIPVLHEVAGDTALYANPNDPAAWTKAINECLPAGAPAMARATAGLEYVRKYSLEACGRRLLLEARIAGRGNGE
ncbi:N/A [soil metagenome]